jgi:hypothetical protein
MGMIMKINKAVIPAAGLGTRFLPYTKASWTDGGIRLGFNIQRSFWL